VELKNWFEIGRIAGEARLGCDVLTCVVTFGGAVPEEKATVEGCRNVQFMLSLARWCDCSYEWTVHQRRSLHGCSPVTTRLAPSPVHQLADKSTVNRKARNSRGRSS